MRLRVMRARTAYVALLLATAGPQAAALAQSPTEATAARPSLSDVVVPEDDIGMPPPVSAADFGETAPAGIVLEDTIEIAPVTAADFDAGREMPAATGSVEPAAGPKLRAMPQVAPLPGAQQATAPEAAPALPQPSAAEQIGQALAALLADEAALKALPAPDRAALRAFYAERGNAPVWIAGGRISAAGQAAITRIKAAADDGLDPDAFVTPDPALGENAPARAEELARAEIALAGAALGYARQAQAGRISPRAVSPLITAQPPVPEPAEVLKTVAAAADPAAALGGFNPSHPGYLALRDKLAEARKAAGPELDVPTIPAGPPVKVGMSDARVPLVRKRLGIEGAPDDLLYDETLAAAVQKFQKPRGLGSSGILGPRTVAALNIDRRGNPVADLIANMERWRWLPRDLGQRHVFVNIPEFEVRIVENGQTDYRGRVVVGKPQNQTPVFSDQMEFIIVNPYWNVPSSIAVKEMLPQLRADPTYLARQGIEVRYVNGKTATVVDSTQIDWNNTSLKNLHFRQPPGERNALGRIKFMFPNEHAVYLHDTPSRSLFGRDVRAFSHGCVRVDQPFQFADALAGRDGITGKRLASLIGGSEKRLNLPAPIPVHLAYFTAFVDESGTLQTRPDIYGHDRKVKSLLALEKIATAAN